MKVKHSLKNHGYFYASFKCGQGERIKKDRFFNDYSSQELKRLMMQVGFEVKEIYITTDVRQDRHNECWINSIVSK